MHLTNQEQIAANVLYIAAGRPATGRNQFKRLALELAEEVLDDLARFGADHVRADLLEHADEEPTPDELVKRIFAAAEDMPKRPPLAEEPEDPDQTDPGPEPAEEPEDPEEMDLGPEAPEEPEDPEPQA